jgi:hypothetical protein
MKHQSNFRSFRSNAFVKTEYVVVLQHVSRISLEYISATFLYVLIQFFKNKFLSLILARILAIHHHPASVQGSSCFFLPRVIQETRNAVQESSLTGRFGSR